ncbi:MAG: endopeptidase La [Elusimicrobia bacterium]|nr:endopeptidase La [Elusimicrobiota bacterium]
MKLLPPESISKEDSTTETVTTETGAPPTGRLPVLPVRDVVLFPYMVLPVAVGRVKSLAALEASSRLHDRRILVLTQKSPKVEDPGAGDLQAVGTIGQVAQVFKLPDGSVKTFIQGIERVRAGEISTSGDNGYFEAGLEALGVQPVEDLSQAEALTRLIRQAFGQYLQLAPNAPQEMAGVALKIDDPDRLTDIVAANVALKLEEKQKLLEMADVQVRLELIYSYLLREIDILNLEKKIQSRVRTQIEKSQREYLLQEQMKAIQKELKHRDDHGKELDELKTKIKKAGMTKEAEEAAAKEIGRLEKMMPYSPEATVARTYLDWLVTLPWSQATADNLDLGNAAKVLHEDHFGLDKAKERILEYLAVCMLKGKLRGPVLCFVGPPGVGKTSLARSVARALGRKFVRVSLGGVADESEIRGHRRTYIGALPGKVLQELRKASAKNPVFLLDEIDKMGTDWRGDPAAALLEVLDPEQNKNFVDHYIDVGFDLSGVFFIATANTMHAIPATLRDRLEVIRFSDYTLEEKNQIARRYLIPKQTEENGLKDYLEVEFSNEALTYLIERYTHEAGVRNLEREIASILRKMAKEIALKGKVTKAAESQEDSKTIREIKTPQDIEKYLRAPKFLKTEASANGVGVATGLAWTEYGGDILTIEVAHIPGRGNLILTGKLGPTMQESAQAAFTYVRSISDRLALNLTELKTHDLHLHVPEGAIPKDGPSAGVAMAVCLASFLTKRPVRASLAMTGEITLLGRVLPVGGIREKLIAARRHGIKTVLIPRENAKDLEDIPEEVKRDLEVCLVDGASEVLEASLA